MLKHLLLSVVALAFVHAAQAQCIFADTATISGDTLFCNGGDDYKTVVAFNPVDSIYYSINAGGITPNEYYDYQGLYLGNSTNADFRGLWYNASTGLIEGNCWDYYFVADSMTAEGYFSSHTATPLGAGAVTSPPDMQCAGAFDYDANNILYYFNDTLWGESRTNLVDITPVALTGQSLTNVVRATLIFTGCAGKEIGLYDHVDKKLYLFNKTTGAHAQTIAIPDAPANVSISNYHGIAFANNIFWLYSGTNHWIGFDIFGTATSLDRNTAAPQVQIYPNPAKNIVYLSAPSNVSIFNSTGARIAYLQNTNELNISNYAAGVYILQLHDASGRTTQIQKIVKE